MCVKVNDESLEQQQEPEFALWVCAEQTAVCVLKFSHYKTVLLFFFCLNVCTFIGCSKGVAHSSLTPELSPHSLTHSFSPT